MRKEAHKANSDTALQDIINGNGVTLQQHWKSTGGVPQAYRGTLVSEFPNLFLIWG